MLGIKPGSDILLSDILLLCTIAPALRKGIFNIFLEVITYRSFPMTILAQAQKVPCPGKGLSSKKTNSHLVSLRVLGLDKRG